MSLELLQIINGCKKQDIKSQKLLFEKFKDLVYHTSLKYCSNKQEAEDHVHDVFIVLFKSIKKYKPTGSFEGWIKRITIYRAIDKFKKQKKIVDKPYLVENESVPVTIEESYLDIPLQFIFEAIKELPERYRMVFNLYELDNYTHKEIADLLSISIGTSKSNLHRAKVLLREKLMPKNSPKVNSKHI